ncbi:MAG TPA: NAD(P)-binding domain-containing protein [Aestuariivirga sp.]|nr:NAD(P)-binding domain-containing protein [Aestuariivirga sp.]
MEGAGMTTKDNEVKTVGVIGLGSMGQGMAQSMIRKGLPVAGFDVAAKAVAALEAAGGRAAATGADAAKNADILVVVVVNAAQVEAVLFGDGGTAAAMKAGGVIISSVTMSPDDARRFAGKAQALGLHFLDAPISGGAAKAATGQLTVMASGSAEAFAAARPALDAMAATVYELGSEPGQGAAFKMVNQLLAGVHIAAACEAVAFAARLGLDLPTVYKVITASAGNSWMFENRVPHIVDGDYTPRSAVDIFTKDLGIVSDMGRSEKFPLAMSAAALQMFLATAAAGMGRDDDASVARMLAQITGVKLPQGGA